MECQQMSNSSSSKHMGDLMEVEEAHLEATVLRALRDLTAEICLTDLDFLISLRTSKTYYLEEQEVSGEMSQLQKEGIYMHAYNVDRN